MRAEIICIGTELLLGQIPDTDAFFLAGELPSLGIDLLWITQVGDNLGRIISALTLALSRSDLVITVGGLGPTEDDLTREAIAAALGEEMRIDPELESWLRRSFAELGREFPERNIKQAAVIPSARPIPNPLGTAPGWWVEREGKLIIALPGPPQELQTMWREEIKPRLRERLGGEIIISRVLKVWGISEARVDELMGDLLRSSNPTLAPYAKPDGIHLRLTAKAPSREKAEEMLASLEGRIREILGEAIWGVDEETLPSLICRALEERSLSLSVGETVTQGLLTEILSRFLPGGERFRGGVTFLSREAAAAAGLTEEGISDLEGPKGALSLARLARKLFRSDASLGITGLLSPHPQKMAMDYHVAVEVEGREKLATLRLPLKGPEPKLRAAFGALFTLHRLLSSGELD